MLTQRICQIFHLNYRAYGTRRIKEALKKEGIFTSRKRIARIMMLNGWRSKYTVKKYRTSKGVNEADCKNEIQREFSVGQKKRSIVTDLTYINVQGKWHYICTLLDLSTRKIVSHSIGVHKNASLVMTAISQLPMNLSSIDIFHSDRGKEFDNQLIDDCLTTFGIKRSLSKKGCPYDNAVAEATFKSIKTEFVKGEKFTSLEHLQARFDQYVNWFNYIRLHSSLDYQTPMEFQNQQTL